MIRLDRILQRVRYDISRLLVPPHRRRVVQTRAPGFDLLVLANEDVGRAIHFVGNFETAEVAYLREVLTPSSVCIDVGANIGFFTLLMAIAAPHGRVHAFEPLPLNVALLGASVALNRLANVSVNAVAVGAAPGTADFVEAADGAYSSLHDTGRKPVAALTQVAVVTLDDVCDGLGNPAVDVLKIDVEGAEALVLAGAARLLGDPARRPTTIMLELEQHNLDRFGVMAADLVALLAGHGYSATQLDRDGRRSPYDGRTGVVANLIFSVSRGFA